MDMLKMLKSLFQAAFSDEPVPPKKSAASSGSGKTRTAPKKAASKTSSAPASGRRKGTVSRSGTKYTEESIFGGGNASSYLSVPQEIRQMRTLSGFNSLSGTRSMESLFYQQGKYMEYYSDDFPENVACGRTTPMYYNMKNDELRCYFTWRTRYRQGALPAAQNAFLLLYAFELLNLIGVQTAEEGYTMLEKLLEDYGQSFPAIRRQLIQWLPDFAAYYELPARIDDSREAAAITILRHSAHTDEELLLALDMLSRYHLKDSRLFLARPAETAAVLKAVYQAMLTHYAETKKLSFPAFLLGEQKRQQHIMFEGAVFHHRTLQKNRDVRLSPLCTYHCFNGEWAKETFCSDPRSDRIGALLRTFDSVLREALNFKGKLKAGELPEGDEEVIRLAVREYYEEQKRKNAPVIRLDESELAAIRAAAAHTTDMLTLPEDEAEPAETIAAPVSQPEVTAADSPEEDSMDTELPDLPLSAPALALLLCLLSGESYQPLTDAGQMLSVLADEINENLYDSIGDTVIEMADDDTPVLIEDYREDLKKLLGEALDS